MLTDAPAPQKRLADLTLTELNDLLPVGWQATLTDLAKGGAFDAALIQALGVDFGTFYRLKKENVYFRKVISECELWRLTFWHGLQKAMIFGDLNPRASGLLIRILEKLEKNFDAQVDRIFDVQKAAVDKKALLDAATEEELEGYAFSTADLITELTKRGADLTDFTDGVENEPSPPADFIEATDGDGVENEPSDDSDDSDVPKSLNGAMRWRLKRKQMIF